MVALALGTDLAFPLAGQIGGRTSPATALVGRFATQRRDYALPMLIWQRPRGIMLFLGRPGLGRAVSFWKPRLKGWVRT